MSRPSFKPRRSAGPAACLCACAASSLAAEPAHDAPSSSVIVIPGQKAATLGALPATTHSVSALDLSASINTVTSAGALQYLPGVHMRERCRESHEQGSSLVHGRDAVSPFVGDGRRRLDGRRCDPRGAVGNLGTSLTLDSTWVQWSLQAASPWRVGPRVSAAGGRCWHDRSTATGPSWHAEVTVSKKRRPSHRPVCPSPPHAATPRRWTRRRPGCLRCGWAKFFAFDGLVRMDAASHHPSAGSAARP